MSAHPRGIDLNPDNIDPPLRPMTGHELAAKLLALPDLPVAMRALPGAWGIDWYVDANQVETGTFDDGSSDRAEVIRLWPR